jgi:poly(hydroxyalkanoate) granule-associated protein
MEERMARKKTSRGAADSTEALRDSAQKIWLAGLGAFERARTEGPRMFESLVEQGRNMGARAVGAADQALRTMREADYAARFDKLEKAFEERVSASLKRFGVLGASQLDDLARQVRELNDRLQASGAPETRKRPRRGTKKRAASRPAAKAKARTTKRSKAAAKPRGKRAA